MADETQISKDLKRVIEIIEPFEEMGVSEAKLTNLTRSTKGSHKVEMWLDIVPESLGLRDLHPLVFGLPILLYTLQSLAEDRLLSESRDKQVRDLLEQAEEGSTSPEDALAGIRELMAVPDGGPFIGYSALPESGIPPEDDDQLDEELLDVADRTDWRDDNG